MAMIVDTHLHLYPCYRIEEAIRALKDHLHRWAPQATPIGLLAEARDCHVFSELATAPARLQGIEIQTCEEAGEKALQLVIDGDDRRPLYLLPGRQIVTRERLEVLSLTVDTPDLDDAPLQDVVDKVRERRGVPTLAWAPGKWFGGRGALIGSMLSTAEPSSIALGDTTLRPYGWACPRLMKLGMRRGMPRLAGSDPLPFEGEEATAGQYASLLDAAFDSDRPVSSVRAALLGSRAHAVAGRRGSFLSVVNRLRRHSRSKK